MYPLPITIMVVFCLQTLRLPHPSKPGRIFDVYDEYEAFDLRSTAAVGREEHITTTLASSLKQVEDARSDGQSS